jgi:hypothetical protein
MLTLRTTLVEDNNGQGIVVYGSHATVDASAVRGTLDVRMDQGARGIDVEPSPDTWTPSTVAMRASLVERNTGAGVFVGGSEAALQGNAVLDTQPGRNGRGGEGAAIEPHLTAQPTPEGTGRRSTATIRECLFQGNHRTGVFIVGSTVRLEASEIRDTQTDGMGFYARGLNVQHDSYRGSRSTVVVRGTRIETSYEIGLFAAASDVVIEGTAIVDTFAEAEGTYGDGLCLWSDIHRGTATVVGTRVERSARAAISNFGGDMTLGGSALACQPIDLAGNPQEQNDFSFIDLGGNLCGCPEADGPCKMESATLEPPDPIGGLE